MAIVTGAGSGIGRASALAFARHGAKVFCTDWNEDACQQTVAQIRAAGGEADGMAADAGDEALAERAVKICVERTSTRRPRVSGAVPRLAGLNKPIGGRPQGLESWTCTLPTPE